MGDKPVSMSSCMKLKDAILQIPQQATRNARIEEMLSGTQNQDQDLSIRIAWQGEAQHDVEGVYHR
jgi:hypothetical protein